jgi:hypothetical protein
MKKIIALSVSAFLLTPNLWASATCSKGRGKVILNDNYTMDISGLDSKGIKRGLYSCTVIGEGPGYLSTQREVQCEKQDEPGVVIMGWMIEGLDMYGHQAASVALYNNNGAKVFEAACSKN